ncbi:NCOA1 protein, partial [Certhia brachydactyla]|nr:NCOA1 protein [Certhia brachydactyla]
REEAAGCNSMAEFPGMPQQSEAAFAPALSPSSPLMSPQLPPAPGYQSPELKSWQAGNIGNNGVFGPAAPAAPAPSAPAAAPAGMYNNMSITVSMAGSGGGSGIGSMGGGAGAGIAMNPMMAAGMGAMCAEQVPEASLRPPGLYCGQLGSGELLKAEPDGAQVRHTSGRIPK